MTILLQQQLVNSIWGFLGSIILEIKYKLSDIWITRIMYLSTIILCPFMALSIVWNFLIFR